MKDFFTDKSDIANYLNYENYTHCVRLRNKAGGLILPVKVASRPLVLGRLSILNSVIQTYSRTETWSRYFLQEGCYKGYFCRNITK